MVRFTQHDKQIFSPLTGTVLGLGQIPPVPTGIGRGFSYGLSNSSRLGSIKRRQRFFGRLTRQRRVAHNPDFFRGKALFRHFIIKIIADPGGQPAECPWAMVLILANNSWRPALPSRLTWIFLAPVPSAPLAPE